jgi:hypothetical protein
MWTLVALMVFFLAMVGMELVEKPNASSHCLGV